MGLREEILFGWEMIEIGMRLERLRRESSSLQERTI